MPNHALNGSNFDAGLRVKALLPKLTDIVYVIQSQQFFQLNLFEYILSLLTEGVAIHQK